METKTPPIEARPSERLRPLTPNTIRIAAEADFGRTAIDYISGLTTPQSQALRRDAHLAPFPLPGALDRASYEDTLIRVVGDTVTTHRMLKDRGETTKLSDNELGDLVFSTIASLHAREAFDAGDLINGITRDIQGATPKRSEEINHFHKRIAENQGLSPTDITQNANEATAGGGQAYFMTYLENFNGDTDVRTFMEDALTGRSDIPTFADAKLRAYWNMFTTLKRLGLDFDQLAELWGLPSTDGADQLLRHHLQSMKGPEEHDLFSFLRKRAQERAFPDTMRDAQEIEDDVNQIRALFPILTTYGDKVSITSHTGPGTEPRPVAVTYTNAEGDKIIWQNISSIRSRSEFRQFVGHEATHAAQSAVKETARKNGFYGSPDVEPPTNDAIDEIFSQLVERQIVDMDSQADRILSNGSRESHVTEDTPEDMLETLRKRKQIVQALVNRNIQKRFEDIWDGLIAGELEGDDVIMERLRAADRAVRSELNTLRSIGPACADPTMTTQELYAPLFPYDGRVYQMDILMKGETDETATPDEKSTTSNPESEIKYLFEQKFGRIWITDPDAQTVLANMFLQSGTHNFDQTQLPELARLSPEIAAERLESAGIVGYSSRNR